MIGAGGSVERSITYGELAAAVAALAARLAHELPPGAVAMLVLPNCIEYIVAYLALLAAGAAVFPVHPDLTDLELRKAAGESRARKVLGPAAAARAVAPLGVENIPLEAATDVLRSAAAGSLRTGALPRPRGASASAAPPLRRDESAGQAESRFSGRPGSLLLQSSGTTGPPRIVVRDGPSLDAVAANVAESVGLGPADRVLGVVPLYHSYGIENGLMAPLLAGACAHVCRGFDPAVVIGQLREAGITVFPGVPFMFEVLSQVGEGRGPFPALRRAYSAGAPLPRSVFDAFAARAGLPLGQLYGATEIGSVTFNDVGTPGFDPGSVGRPMRGVSVRILDAEAPRIDRPLAPGAEGQVAVEAPSMLRAYGDGQAPALEGGHFLTGDLGRLDVAGALTITGRLKLLIDVGGFKVNPLEVEAAIAEHPAVRECVVVPMPVSPTLMRLKAFVTLAPGGGIAPGDLRRFARARLTAYKVPRVFEIRERLPKSPTGKVQRQQLMHA